MNQYRLSRFFVAVLATGAVLCSGNSAAAAVLSSPQSSSLASGKWIKVSIPGDGICQITYDQLREWGFSAPQRVKVYGFGPYALQHNMFSSGEATDIYPTYFEHTADNRIVFYGATDHPVLKGQINDNRYKVETLRSNYDTNSYYLISDCELRNGSLPQPLQFNDGSYDKISSHIHIESEDIDNFNYCRGGTFYHNRTLKNGDNISVKFPIRDYSETDNNSACLTAFIAASSKSRPFTPQIAIELPTELTSIENQEIKFSISPNSGAYSYAMGQTYNVFRGENVASPIADGTYPFNINIPNGLSFTYLAYDRMHLTYTRNNIVRPDEPWLIMNFPYASAWQVFDVTGLAINDARVVDISDARNVRPYETVYRTATKTIEATFNSDFNVNSSLSNITFNSGAARVIAFDIKKQFPQVSFAGDVINQNIHGDRTPDMVIVTTRELLPYAQELADLHARHDGLITNVYTQDQVFNEFSYGNRAAMGIKRLCKMFFDRSRENPAGTQFKYLLMYGPSVYDNKNVELKMDRENLICYEVDDTYADSNAPCDIHLNYCADMFFAYLDDKYEPRQVTKLLPSIAVGRIPATNTVDAAIVNKKIAKYVSTPQSAETFSRALVYSDDGDANKHISQAYEVTKMLRSVTPITVYQPHNSIFYRKNKTNALGTERILNALKKGVGYYSYTGHGDTRSFTAESIYNLNILNDNDYTTLPYAHLSTCYAVELDQNSRNIGEAMLFKPDGGVIALSAACRAVYIEYNQILNLGVAKAYANATPGTTVGDIWLNGQIFALKPISQSTQSDAFSYYSNTFCYNLCGDPAIKLPIPEQKSVFINNIDGQSVSLPGDAETKSVTVKQLQPFNFRGFVSIPGTHNIDTDFNGEVLVEFYEASSTKPIVVNDSDDKDDNLPVDECLLSDVRLTVTNGEFNGQTMLPTAYNADGECRIVMTAVSRDDKNDGRIGHSNALALDNTEIFDGNTDITAPQVTEMFIDGFENGQDVPADFTLKAEIAVGDGGLSTGNTLMAPGARLILDKTSTIKAATNYLVMNADGTASLKAPVFDVADGAHTLTLAVADKLGNASERTISFIVRNNTATAVLAADNSVARTDVTFSLQSTLAGDSADAYTRLIICDADGNTVFSVENPTLPYTWDLRDTGGKDVPDGRYSAALMQKSFSRFTSTPRIPVTVIRPVVQ